MDRNSWVVSNPPHQDLHEAAAAALLGLALAEFRIKVNFTAPEVWLAYPEHEAAAEAATALRDVGLNVAVVPGPHLARLPWPEAVSSFSFEDDRLVAVLGDGTIELPYDAAITGVYCKPPSDAGTGVLKVSSSLGSGRRAVGLARVAKNIGGVQDQDASQLASKLEASTNLDLYVSHEATLRRVTIAQAVTDFGGLGDEMLPRAGDNMDACVKLVDLHFTDISLDQRLVDVRPRRRFVLGGEEKAHETRKLFSFGTLGLRDLIEAASPGLRDITQYELGSRLAYIMKSQAGAAAAWVE